MNWKLTRLFKRRSSSETVSTESPNMEVSLKIRQEQFKQQLSQVSEVVGDHRLDRLTNTLFRKKTVYLVLESPHACLTELSGHSIANLIKQGDSRISTLLDVTSGETVGLPSWYVDGDALMMGMHFKDEVYASSHSFESYLTPLLNALGKRKTDRRLGGAIIYIHHHDLISGASPAWLTKMASLIQEAGLKSKELVPVYMVLEGGSFNGNETSLNTLGKIVSTPIGLFRDEETINTEQFSQWYSQACGEISRRLLRKTLKDVQYVHNIDSRRSLFSELDTVEESLHKLKLVSEYLNHRWHFANKSIAPWIRGAFIAPDRRGTQNSTLKQGLALSTGVNDSNRDIKNIEKSIWWQRFSHLLVKDRYCSIQKQEGRLNRRWVAAACSMVLGVITLFWSQFIFQDYTHADELAESLTSELISFSTNQGVNDNAFSNGVFSNESNADSLASKTSNAYIVERSADLTLDKTLNDLSSIEKARDQLVLAVDKDNLWLSSLSSSVAERGGVLLNSLSNRVLSEQFGQRLDEVLLEVLKSNNEFEVLYPALKAYLSFHSERDGREDYLMWWFGREWQERYQNDASKRQLLAQHLSNFLSRQPISESHDEETVLIARTKMLSTPLAKRLYIEIKQAAKEKRNTPGELKDIIGYRQSDIFYNPDSLVLPFYTSNGYQTGFLPQLYKALDQASLDQWVLGENKQDNVNDVKSLEQAIYQLYITDYLNAWDHFLKNLSVTKTQSLDLLGGLIQSSSGNEGAIRRVLQYAYDNTALYSVLPDMNSKGVVDGLSSIAPNAVTAKLNKSKQGVKQAESYLASQRLPSIHPMKRVSAYFERLNSVTKNSENKSSAMDEVDRQLFQLEEYLADFEALPNESFSHNVIFEATKKRVNGVRSDPISHLKKMSKMMPEPLSDWVYSISSQAWGHMVYSTKEHIKKAYKDEVYTFYASNLKSKYPLNTKSLDDIDVERFGDYFKPDGEEQNFFNHYIKPFVRMGSRKWSERKIDGMSLGLKRDYLSQLKRAQTIRNAIFNESQEIFAELQFQPIYLDANLSRFELNLMGEQLSYRHGPQKVSTVRWPGQINDTEIAMKFEDYNGNLVTEALSGEWALFRLIDKYAKETKKDGRRYRMSFEVNGQRAVYDVSGRSLTPGLLGMLSKYRMPLKPLS